MVRDKAKVTVDDKQEVASAVSNGTKSDDLVWPWTALTQSAAQIDYAFSNLIVDIWEKINPHCERWSSPETSFRFAQIFAKGSLKRRKWSDEIGDL